MAEEGSKDLAMEVTELGETREKVIAAVDQDDLVYRELTSTDNPTFLRKWSARLCPQPIYNSLKPPMNKRDWRKFWEVHIPIWHWLYYYVPKFLIGDIVAGLTIGVTHIPQGIGFALLALVPPVFGLYSSFVPVLLYTIFGTSKHLSVGTFPIVSLMTADAIHHLGHQLPELVDCTSNSSSNISSECFSSSCHEYNVEIAVTLSFLVGVIMILMSFFKLGFVSLFLSDALISGYTAAAAFSIVVTQISVMFGLDGVKEPEGLFITPIRFVRYCTHIAQGKVTPAAIITSIICFIILISVDLTNRFIKKRFKKFPIHIPGQLIVVIITTFISYVANLNENFGLDIIDDHGGIPSPSCFVPTLPKGNFIQYLISDAFVIAIVGFALNIAQSKLLALKNGYSIHPDQELFAYGIMNFGGSFFGSIPTAGALSRTVLQDAVGGNTQLVGLISSFVVLLVILVLGFLFGSLPNAAIAVVVVMALKGLLFQIRDVRKYFYLHWPDMLVWFVVFFATLMIRLDIGLLIGVAFSIITIIVRTMLPFSPGLGEARGWVYHIQGSEQHHDKDLEVVSLPDIYIYQFNAPLYFANCAIFRSRLFIECDIDPQVFDKDETSCFRACGSNNQFTTLDNVKQSKETFSDASSPSPEPIDKELLKSNEIILSELSENSVYASRYHTVIIDCGPVGFVDSMGSAMLEKVVAEFDSISIQVLFAAPTTPVCTALDRYGFFKRYSSERLFPSVKSAVLYAKTGQKVPSVSSPKRLSKKLATNFERQLAYPTRPTMLEVSTGEEPQGSSNLYKRPKAAETAL